MIDNIGANCLKQALKGNVTMQVLNMTVNAIEDQNLVRAINNQLQYNTSCSYFSQKRNIDTNLIAMNKEKLKVLSITNANLVNTPFKLVDLNNLVILNLENNSFET